MGLDNEFILKSKKALEFPDYTNFEKLDNKQGEYYVYNFGYQRKNWSYGHAVLTAIQGVVSDPNLCEFEVEKTMIPAVIEKIYDVILDPEDFDSQVFEFKECLPAMAQTIVDLNWLYNNWNNNDNIKLEFIHSF